MALIYAGALLGVATDEKDDCFSRIRLSLYMIAIILMKSIGFVWAFFAFSYYIIWKRARRVKINIYDILIVIGPIFVLASWNVFCIFTNRSAYLTENMFDAFFREKNWICAIQSRFFIVQTFFKNFFTAELCIYYFKQQFWYQFISNGFLGYIYSSGFIYL